jgi:glycosyltransferase involved in cell wall biosynthesis
VEAMASGLPIVASDTPVHHEICAGSAVFFDRFSPTGLAEQVLRVATSEGLTQELKSCAEKRSADFSWRTHMDKIVEIAQALSAKKN